MNLTKKQKKVLSKLFDKIIMKFNKLDVWMISKKPSLNTYFISSTSKFITMEDLELSLENEKDIINALENMWKDLPIKDLAKKIIKNSSHFREIKKNEEVSPFLYEMF